MQDLDARRAHEARLKEAILNAARQAGVAHLRGEYSGAGDSGDHWEVSLEPDNPELDQDVTVELAESQFDAKSREYKTVLVETTLPLSELFDRYMEMVVESRHGGWENNEGGAGSLTIDVVEGTVTLEHTTYFEASETDTYAL
ncbi:DUF6878 family protein [Caldimonas sp. KR1-144]|uniref:DUF6878 family protein n=1 Tax=Caldimonas sp. KR1-144 TaxID=3400911 RepID=UPI003BFF6523